ncbi:MAG: HPr family phosphocarrier protein [Ruminococcaceae bacterium]|nr:HPr family phosphocarrier protein [Oscillospiraceae bacterium]
MTSVEIKLASIQDIRTFVEKVSRHDMEVDLSSGRYIVDAKSIMGIFSLDLANTLTLTAHGEDCDDLLTDLSEYIVK